MLGLFSHKQDPGVWSFQLAMNSDSDGSSDMPQKAIIEPVSVLDFHVATLNIICALRLGDWSTMTNLVIVDGSR